MSETRVLLYFDGFSFGYVAQDIRLREKKIPFFSESKNPAKRTSDILSGPAWVPSICAWEPSTGDAPALPPPVTHN
jgi:hypothetical protein